MHDLYINLQNPEKILAHEIDRASFLEAAYFLTAQIFEVFYIVPRVYMKSGTK